MSAVVTVGVGAVIGAVVGACGGGAVMVWKEKEKKKTTTTEEVVVVDEDPPPTPVATKKRHTVLGNPTDAFSRASNMYVPLLRFHSVLQFQEEFDALRVAIEHLDRLYCMEKMLHSSTTTLRSGNTITYAQRACNAALAQLHAITEFSHRVRPSETKRGGMERNIEDISDGCDAVTDAMLAYVAATPYYAK
jgi:hypothetical protein